MSATIPEKFLPLLRDKKAFAHVATVLNSGKPQVTPVWFDYTNSKIRINTATGRVKHKTMQMGKWIALSIQDPDNAYRYIQIRGPITKITQQGADAHIDSLAKKYLGQDKYPFRRPDEERVMYEIAPESVQTMGD